MTSIDEGRNIMVGDVMRGLMRVGQAYNKEHPGLVEAIMLASTGVSPPALGDLDCPNRWSGANWRWFFENTWGPVDESL